MIRHLLFLFSRTYRANCMIACVLEYDRVVVQLSAVRKAAAPALELAA